MGMCLSLDVEFSVGVFISVESFADESDAGDDGSADEGCKSHLVVKEYSPNDDESTDKDASIHGCSFGG